MPDDAFNHADILPADIPLATIPPAWRDVLAPVLAAPAGQALAATLNARTVAGAQIFPPDAQRFAALAAVPPGGVRVVILGQDPYHGAGQANGLAFSVNRGVRVPPSLGNIYREITRDLDIPPATHGDLTHWAAQGVLLLNTALSVAAGQPGSHRGVGWGPVTDTIMRAVAGGVAPVAFLLWGNPARDTALAVPEIASGRHLVLTAPHPSPLSAYRGFIGCGHFSAANAFLGKAGRGAIDWRVE